MHKDAPASSSPERRPAGRRRSARHRVPGGSTSWPRPWTTRQARRPRPGPGWSWSLLRDLLRLGRRRGRDVAGLLHGDGAGDLLALVLLRDLVLGLGGLGDRLA